MGRVRLDRKGERHYWYEKWQEDGTKNDIVMVW